MDSTLSTTAMAALVIVRGRDDLTIAGVARIDCWIATQPHNPSEFEDAFLADELSASQCVDAIDNNVYRMTDLIEKLNRAETAYRIMGLKYHKLPNGLRHSAPSGTTPSATPLAPGRLRTIFEPDKPRTEQAFFTYWFKLQTVARRVNAEAHAAATITDVERLRSSLEACERRVHKGEKYFRELAIMLNSINALLQQLSERRVQGWGEADLSMKFGLEGGIFRRWVSTLIEFQPLVFGSGREVLNFAEDIAQDLLAGRGLDGQWWSV
ncbi:hypothetical protein BDV95DRAFT_670630 [Massariosphaeria phaeospora]|uniref:Uncharacterized protein n=1 Tax=Massariosphaeria phaeospora TaxID=100035 RepID=A0A7C8I194_9PLEO|nr:hypothetical protein BDV95DRAFT_670630 [Massariosphaeria phaeospora]